MWEGACRRWPWASHGGIADTPSSGASPLPQWRFIVLEVLLYERNFRHSLRLSLRAGPG
ncbi:hypothetical protein C4J97_3384 [Pseudomonas orientalis]|nr:hypothetical protein C4J97_3384 [Pseudomonas orientalis]